MAHREARPGNLSWRDPAAGIFRPPDCARSTGLSLLEPPCLAIFDHDGVLIDSLAFHQAAWVELGKRAGLPISPEFIHETFGMTNPTILRKLLGDSLDDASAMRLSDLKERCYRASARGQIRLMDGVRELLDDLSAAGVRLAIGSSSVRPNLDLTVESCGLSGRFSAIVSLEDIQRGKPNPDVFLRAAERAGAAPSRCVVFEDAPVGIQAAKAAGMRAVGVATTHPIAALHEAGADEVTERLVNYPVRDLVAWISRSTA
jgi:beta-phosphoglucomutase